MTHPQLELVPILFTGEQCHDYSHTLKTLLHGYLYYAFRLGINEDEAMTHFENVQSLLAVLDQCPLSHTV